MRVRGSEPSNEALHENGGSDPCALCSAAVMSRHLVCERVETEKRKALIHKTF
jgi:hypothetical protein